MFTRRSFSALSKQVAALLLGAANTLWAPPALAQYPEKPIRFVVPFPPGGGADAAARIVADKLGPLLGQPVVVDNRPGGDTIIGTDHVAKSAPDGYTFVVGSVNMVSVNKTLYPNLPYDLRKDFVPVAMISTATSVLVVNAGLGINTFQQFIDYAKANPGKLNYGTSSSSVLLYEKAFQNLFGVVTVNIPYRGSQGVVQGVASGDLHYAWEVPQTVLPLVRSRKVVPLATMARERTPSLPDVPTVFELGVPQVAEGRGGFWGVLAPKNTPKAIVDRINAGINEVLKHPDAQRRLAALEALPAGGTPQEFGIYLEQRLKQFEAWVVQFGVKPQ